MAGQDRVKPGSGNSQRRANEGRGFE